MAAGLHDAASFEVECLASTRILCVGDLMLDRFVHGSVERISPEAPVPVIRVEREDMMLGGAGNVARNLTALGVRSVVLGVVGDDEAGGEVARLVEQDTAEAHLEVEPGRPTTVKTRYLTSGQQLLRADRETAAPIALRTSRALLRRFSQALSGCDAVVVSDYAKGTLTDEVLSAVIDRAREEGVPVLADPKSADFRRYHGATVLAPNRDELAAATQHRCDGDKGIAEAAVGVLAACAVQAMVITRGPGGLSLVAADAAPVHLRAAKKEEVYDVSGAGDTVLAVLAAALAAGADLPTAAALANCAGGVVVGKVGTAVVHPTELATAAAASLQGAADAKVCALNQVRDRIAVWRRRGERIGFTNGCFDLLHPGHVALLDEARAACDRLIVGLNSDDSARRLKGPDRPVQDETTRAAMLASYAAVEVVVVFGADTPIELIEAIRPDVLVKGADYHPEEVVGAEFVESYGGRVLLAEIRPGHSTTETIRRMAG